MLWIGALYSSGAGRGPNGAVQPMRTNSRFPWPTSAAKVILKAVEAGVPRFVMVSSLGTGRFGMPASALNLFWGCLTHKRRAELALEQSTLVLLDFLPCVVSGSAKQPPWQRARLHRLAHVRLPWSTRLRERVQQRRVRPCRHQWQSDRWRRLPV